MSKLPHVPQRKLLVPLLMAAGLLSGVAAAQPVAAPVKGVASETIVCPSQPSLLLDYKLKGELNVPQGWTVSNRSAGEVVGNVTVALSATSAVQGDRLLCSYRASTEPARKNETLLLLVMAKPQGRTCEAADGGSFRCSLRLKPPPPR